MTSFIFWIKKNKHLNNLDWYFKTNQLEMSQLHTTLFYNFSVFTATWLMLQFAVDVWKIEVTFVGSEWESSWLEVSFLDDAEDFLILSILINGAW